MENQLTLKVNAPYFSRVLAGHGLTTTRSSQTNHYRACCSQLSDSDQWGNLLLTCIFSDGHSGKQNFIVNTKKDVVPIDYIMEKWTAINLYKHIIWQATETYTIKWLYELQKKKILTLIF